MSMIKRNWTPADKNDGRLVRISAVEDRDEKVEAVREARENEHYEGAQHGENQPSYTKNKKYWGREQEEAMEKGPKVIESKRTSHRQRRTPATVSGAFAKNT